MKTAEQWIEEWVEEWAKDTDVTLREIIEQAQKEAYNEALDDAYLLGKVSYELKQSGGNPIYEYRIDKDSILKLKK